MELKVLITEPSSDYELMDSGEGEKLERYGGVVLSRPDPQALSERSLSKEEWDKARAKFSRDGKKAVWQTDQNMPKQWDISFCDLNFRIKLSSFKHTGLFPEQESNWKWIGEKLSSPLAPPLDKGRGNPPKADGERTLKVLNLFGYTGGATLTAAKAGAEVVHVDGSKTAIASAKDNAKLSGLSDAPIRWILDDAFTFVEREIRRKSKYDAIIMDPPSFGRGPEGEVWKIEEKFLPLLKACSQILSDDPLFILVNGYASGYSALAYMSALKDVTEPFKGYVGGGELAIKESKSGRLLPAGIFARWSK